MDSFKLEKDHRKREGKKNQKAPSKISSSFVQTEAAVRTFSLNFHDRAKMLLSKTQRIKLKKIDKNLDFREKNIEFSKISFFQNNFSCPSKKSLLVSHKS